MNKPVENRGKSTTETKQNRMGLERALPSLKWIVLFIVAWLALGLVPQIAVSIGRHWFSVINAESLGVAGVIGDSFGVVGSLFVGAALIFAIRSIILQSREFTESNKLMKDSAMLSAITNIHDHYGDNYGAGDDTGILSAVASGHRRWAIRESFSLIDTALEDQRKRQVESEYGQFRQFLADSKDRDNIIELSKLLGSLLLDRRLDNDQRANMWKLYESVRNDPSGLLDKNSQSFQEFSNACSEFLMQESPSD